MIAELAFDTLPGKSSERTIVLLHGILGRGYNLRTLARRFIKARPEWTALLVDLRGHGHSPKGLPSPSLEAVARDVVNLMMRAAQPAAAVIGHSFGGKVALEAARLAGLDSLQHVMLIDTVPGAREPLRDGDSALAVIEMINSLPPRFASKTDFIEAVVARGLSRDFAQWLAQSVEKQGHEMRFALNLGEIRAFLLDYFRRDLWPVVEKPPYSIHVHLVIGNRSDSYSAADRQRAVSIASANPRVTVDVLPAGHWVHIDDPEGLLRVLLDRIAM